jgi:hypothetical protein
MYAAMKRVALFLKEDQIRKAKKLGKETDRSLASVVRRALDFYFEALKEDRKK